MKIYKKCKTCGKLFTRQGDKGKGKLYCSNGCKRQTIEGKKKISASLIGSKRALGHKKSDKTKIKISLANKGKKASDETKRKLSLILKKAWSDGRRKGGWKHTDEYKKRMSESHKGEKNWNYMGGISKNPYPREFNRGLKLTIRTRDNFICCLCGRTEREELEEFNRVLSVNHKDFDKNNCKESNLNTLCLRCNVKINRKREYWTEYFRLN